MMENLAVEIEDTELTGDEVNIKRPVVEGLAVTKLKDDDVKIKAPQAGGNLPFQSEMVEDVQPRENRPSDESKNCFVSLVSNLVPSKGMLLTLLASILYSFADISVEIATRRVHPNLLLVLHPNVAMALSFIGIIVTGAKVRYNRKQWFYLIVSSGFHSGGSTCLTLAISKIPVGDAIAILNCMPIFGGIFGWVLLKQSLRIIDLVFSLLCIGGVVLIAQPSFIFPTSDDEDERQTEFIGALFALAAACFLALSITINRKVQENGVHILCVTFTIGLSTVLLNVVVCTAMNVWSAPSPSFYWAVAFLPGVFGFFAVLCVMAAVKIERTVMVTIILTSEIVFAFVLQILIIKIIPHWHSAIGSTLILGSCIGMATRKENVTTN